MDPMPPSSPPVPVKKAKILLVEDEKPIRELLRLHLSLAGYDIAEVSDGTAALARAHTAAAATLERLGRIEDRCLLYTFRCAVYYAEGGRAKEKLKWWNWMDAKGIKKGRAR